MVSYCLTFWQVEQVDGTFYFKRSLGLESLVRAEGFTVFCRAVIKTALGIRIQSQMQGVR
jgi:hypothetical protein